MGTISANIKKRPKFISLTDVINAEDFRLMFGDFLHLFKINENRYEMIKAPPIPRGESFDREKLCTLAAAAHKLSNDYGYPVPEWVHDSYYVMPDPVFAFNTSSKEYQEFLLKDTPHEYAMRNLYTGSNVLQAV